MAEIWRPHTPEEIKAAFDFMKGAEEGRRRNIGLVSERNFERSFQTALRIVHEYVTSQGYSIPAGWDSDLAYREPLLAHLALFLSW